ncbi:MAG: hypothetical protein OXD38_15685 [Aestuariivita sp.]|nr:hypothetical protein [Aestuariivita sp.]
MGAKRRQKKVEYLCGADEGLFRVMNSSFFDHAIIDANHKLFTTTNNS